MIGIVDDEVVIKPAFKETNYINASGVELRFCPCL